MKYAFLKNIRKAVAKYYAHNTRLKLEWIIPSAIGIKENKLDEVEASLNPTKNRAMFVQLVREIAGEVEISYKKVLKAIIGEDDDQLELTQKISKNLSRFGSSEKKKNTNRSMSHTNVSKIFKSSTNDLGSFIGDHTN